jgi:paraquat-inducible protein A
MSIRTPLFSVSLQLKIRLYSKSLPFLLRTAHHLDEWGMLEVYMIGILVTIVKMLHMAHVEYDMGFLCFIGLLATTLSSSATMDRALFWREIGRQASEKNQEEKICDRAWSAVSEQPAENSQTR